MTTNLIEQARKDADDVVRYCPECGTIGPLPDARQACCPDSFGMSIRRWQAEKMERILERLRRQLAAALEQRAEVGELPEPVAEVVPTMAYPYADIRAIGPLRIGDKLYTADQMRDYASLAVSAALASAPEAPAQRCPYCDDTGDVHTPTGEWRGRCTCPAGTEAPAQEQPEPARAEVSDIATMVNRFLTWPVPAEVHPDGTPGQPGRTGTNLLNAQQARAMLEHVLAVPPSERMEPNVKTAQALEALDSLEAAARGDEPFPHFAAALIRAALSNPPVAQEQREDAERVARHCHVFNVTKTGALTEWEPTTMAFALPDGKHALYTTPPAQASDADSGRMSEAWSKCKAECDTSGWTVADAVAYRGFFAHGWDAAHKEGQKP